MASNGNSNSSNNNSSSNNNGPSRLERSLSLTSEPRTLRQYEMAIASMQAMEKQRLAGMNNGIFLQTTTPTTTTGGTKGKVDGEEGASGGAAVGKK
ncbi:mini-chromosome maintenance complex-binding protein-like [Cucumis sativus]|uniref:mini-chromosome maintenance complex-binding protein-like n=1 Tax=Cucumis sativus TaxID=3659 RepID=UPI0012F4D9AD|nr:mini-chromosome maintenance complex-binding protein-like [Cucumis sativus]